MPTYSNETTTNKSTLIAVIHSIIKPIIYYWSKYKQHAELTSILEKEALTTYFQPIVDLTSSERIGYELLNRPPVSATFPTTDTFYTFIAETNRFHSVEALCRKLALVRFAKNVKHNQQHHQALVFLNIHPHTLLDKEAAYDLVDLLWRCELSPEQVVLEITEKATVDADERMKEVVSYYREQGIKIALDDIGSGYSSLKTLLLLKPEFMKLDRSLIQSIDSDVTKQQLVTVLVDFSAKTNTTIIAEGIERMEEANFLKDAGVKIGQGYALGKPSQQLGHTTRA